VFSVAQYDYRDGVWDGPVIVLVDDSTGSAAEELPALLQDHKAALVVGSRTAGMGCGHTWGGSPTRLSNSGATLLLPDCSRFRADGTNEVRGIIPDLLIPWRSSDGPRFRARLLAGALPAAVERAAALHRRRPSRAK
jgi:C-terminal processing protease CtpA/Prc